MPWFIERLTCKWVDEYTGIDIYQYRWPRRSRRGYFAKGGWIGRLEAMPDGFQSIEGVKRSIDRWTLKLSKETEK